MSSDVQVLVVADHPLEEGTRMGLAAARVSLIVDPYDALREMGRRHWPLVLLAAPQKDFAGLCRASRRLQGDSRLLAVCPPQAEPDVLPLTPAVLDDYFIEPLTPDDWQQILQSAYPGQARAYTPPAAGQAGLSGAEYSQLVDVARNISDLEAMLAQMVSRRLNITTSWVNADNAPMESRPLLLAAGDVPRVLIGESEASDVSDDAFLVAIQQVLPALISNAQRTESLHRLAITDHLTGAYNRRYFYHLTDQILVRAGQKGFRVSLFLFDIDDFKRYNDTYGYAAGDEILRETTALVKRVTRSHDVVARIGGDEFAVLFWDATRPRSPDSRPVESFYVLADRFRKALGKHQFPSLGPEAKGMLTISGGMANYPADGRNVRELLRSADVAIKQAKKSGKNIVRLIGRE